MAKTQSLCRLFQQLQRSLTGIKFKHILLSGSCIACSSVVWCFASKTSNLFSIGNATYISICNQLTAYADAPESASKTQRNNILKNVRENRFHEFASVEIEGDNFMTPQDFLEAVTEENPRPRIGRLRLNNDQVKLMLSGTPDRKKNSSRFFRSLHDKGLISYTEYLFFLCILTKPKAGFEIAFNMFDADGNQRVDKKEFMVLGEIFRKRTETTHDNQTSTSLIADKTDTVVKKRIMTIQQNVEVLQDTTLLIHLFGKKGDKDLYYEDFYRFMDNLQTEVLEIEFLAYSHGMLTISEEDFARVLLKYTDVADTEEYINTLKKRIPQEKGITFEEFRSFFQFLNNLEDFTIAMQMYTLAGRSIGQDEFKRAVKISTGFELSENLVNTLFQLFDKDGDNKLSQVEFMGVMKERMQRGFRRHGWGGEYVGLGGFSNCVSRELRHFIRDRTVTRS